MYSGDSDLGSDPGETSLKEGEIKTRKVLLPVFLNVLIPDSEDELQAEVAAVDLVRSMAPVRFQNGMLVEVQSIIAPICES